MSAPRAVGRRPNTDSAATRRALLAAASEELASLGYTRMTLASVAAAAGVTRAAIYRYFPSKQELARAVVAELPATYDELVAQHVLTADGLLEQLRALVHVTVSSSFREQRSSLTYFDLARLGQEDETIAEAFRGRSRRVRAVVADLVRRAADRGELAAGADPAEIVDAVSGLLWSFGAGGSGAPNEAVRKQVLLAADLVLRRPDWVVDRSPASP